MDIAVFQKLHSFIGQSFIFDTLVVIFAEYLPYILVLGVIFFIIRKEKWVDKIFVVSFITLSLIIVRGIFTHFIRFLYERPRPYVALDFSPIVESAGPAFPSGHASFFFALAFTLFILSKKWGWWYTGLAVINGIARVFAGVHWPTDILGGIVIAFLGVGVVYLMLNSVMEKLKEAKYLAPT